MKSPVLILMCALAACDKPTASSEQHSATERAPQMPVYDARFIKELKLQRAAAQGAVAADELVSPNGSGKTAELRAAVEKLTHRIEHAEAHFGEPYIHLEEP